MACSLSANLDKLLLETKPTIRKLDHLGNQTKQIDVMMSKLSITCGFKGIHSKQDHVYGRMARVMSTLLAQLYMREFHVTK